MIDLAPNPSASPESSITPASHRAEGENFSAVGATCEAQHGRGGETLGTREPMSLAAPLTMNSVRFTPGSTRLLGTSPSGETEFVSNAIAAMTLALAGVERLERCGSDAKNAPKPRPIIRGVRKLRGNGVSKAKNFSITTLDFQATGSPTSDMGPGTTAEDFFPSLTPLIPSTSTSHTPSVPEFSTSAPLKSFTMAVTPSTKSLAPQVAFEVNAPSFNEPKSPHMVTSPAEFPDSVALLSSGISPRNSPSIFAAQPPSPTAPSPPSPLTGAQSQVALDRRARLTAYAVHCLSSYGFCVIDGFMGTRIGAAVLRAVSTADLREAGRVVAGDRYEEGAVRGDRVAWMEGAGGSPLEALIRKLDGMLMGIGEALGNYSINSRTKAMLACYPGTGKGYARHVDNHRQDGRVLTCIYYLNEHYNPTTDGGLLRLFPSQLQHSIDVEPKFDRLLFFWSDQRTPHEVLPAFRERYAITVWYFDDIERQQARQRMFTADGSKHRNLSPNSLL